MKRSKIATAHLAFRKLKWVIYWLPERTHCRCESSELLFVLCFTGYCVLFLFIFISIVASSMQSNSVHLILTFNWHEKIVYPQYVAYRISKSWYFGQITPNTWRKERDLAEQKVDFVWTALNFSQSRLRISSEN